MNTELFPLSAIEVKQPLLYFLLIKPDAIGAELIKQLKIEFDELFPTTNALAGIPHITVFQSAIKQLSEDQILKQLQEALKETRSFEMRFNGIKAFKNQTLYMDIADDEAFSNISNSIKTQLKGVKPNSAPHMSISRYAKDELLTESLAHFSSRDIQHRFIVDKLYLFKGVAGKNNQLVMTFDLL